MPSGGSSSTLLSLPKKRVDLPTATTATATPAATPSTGSSSSGYVHVPGHIPPHVPGHVPYASSSQSNTHGTTAAHGGVALPIATPTSRLLPQPIIRSIPPPNVRSIPLPNTVSMSQAASSHAIIQAKVTNQFVSGSLTSNTAHVLSTPTSNVVPKITPNVEATITSSTLRSTAIIAPTVIAPTSVTSYPIGAIAVESSAMDSQEGPLAKRSKLN